MSKKKLPPMKIADAAQCKRVWESLKNPSCRTVSEALAAEGLYVSYRTVNRYKNDGWLNPVKAKKVLNKHGKMVRDDKNVVKIGRALPQEITDALLVEAANPESTARVRVARMVDLYNCTLAENQRTLEQTGVIATIMIAEEAIACLGHLIQEAPGDAARLLHAITEATQIKRVGGEGQMPEAGDRRVIDHEPENDMSRAIARFRKETGLG
jgi:hypothetical protein